jgi:hypothetical protein
VFFPNKASIYRLEEQRKESGKAISPFNESIHHRRCPTIEGHCMQPHNGIFLQLTPRRALQL